MSLSLHIRHYLKQSFWVIMIGIQGGVLMWIAIVFSIFTSCSSGTSENSSSNGQPQERYVVIEGDLIQDTHSGDYLLKVHNSRAKYMDHVYMNIIVDGSVRQDVRPLSELVDPESFHHETGLKRLGPNIKCYKDKNYRYVLYSDRDSTTLIASQISAQNEKLNDAYLGAVYQNNIAKVDSLLTAGADVNYQTTPLGTGAMHAIVLIGRDGDETDMLDFLIQKGININMSNSEGSTALKQAIVTGNADLVSLLLLLGADTTITDRYGLSPLYYVDSSHVNMLNALSGG